MSEQSMAEIIRSKKLELGSLKPLLKSDQLNLDEQEKLIQEVAKHPDLPLIAEVQTITDSRDYERLITLFQELKTHREAPDERIGLGYCLAKLGENMLQLTPSSREVAREELENTIETHIKDVGVELMAIDTYLRYTGNVISPRTIGLLEKLKPGLGAKERINLSKRLQHTQSKEQLDLLSDIEYIPEDVSNTGYELQAGDVKIISPQNITSTGLEHLLAITAQRDDEIMLYFDATLERYIYIVGNQFGFTTGNNESLFWTQLVRDVRINLHTHPSKYSLEASERDKKFYRATSPLCRHFIGKYPKVGQETYIGIRFQEFDQEGDKIGGILNLEGMTKKLNQR